MPRVGMDVSPLFDAALTGIPLTVENLLREFLRGDANETTPISWSLVGGQKNELLRILQERGVVPGAAFDAVPGADFRLAEAFPTVGRGPMAWATRKIDGRILKPLGIVETTRRVQKSACDVFHHTALLRVLPRAAPKHIVTIYDLTPRFFPETHNRVNRAEWERVFAFAQSRADLIITDSESAKADVVEHLKIDPARIRAIPLGVRPLPAPLSEAENLRLRAELGLAGDARFVLCVGSLEPRKNVPRMVEAFAQIADEPAFSDVCLVLAGARLHGTDAISDAIGRYNLHKRIVLAGYVPDAQLAQLMRTCDAFVYPSLYEGFGLPVLEALSVGAPVITSNTSALLEVAGNAAVLVDPLSVSEIADALRRVLIDTAFAGDLRLRGPKQAARFSWQGCADAHRAAYFEVAGRLENPGR